MRIELNPTTGLSVDLFGPTVEVLTSPHDVHDDFCVLKGVIPPGSSIPPHSHPDTEDFFVLSGQAQALMHVVGVGGQRMDRRKGRGPHSRVRRGAVRLA